MALLVFNDGTKPRTLDSLKAAELYKVLTGESEGTKAQQTYATRVKAVYLNTNSPDCPQSYKDAHPSTADTNYKAILGASNL